MRTIEGIAVAFVWFLLILTIVTIFTGCEPEQRWGQGELPADYAGFFGTDNKARLDFVQTNRINAFGQQEAEINERLRKLESIDPNDLRGPQGERGPQGTSGDDCVQPEYDEGLYFPIDEDEFRESMKKKGFIFDLAEIDSDVIRDEMLVTSPDSPKETRIRRYAP